MWDPYVTYVTHLGNPIYGIAHMGPLRSPVALPYMHVCWEVAYFNLSDKQLYVNLDRLFGGQRPFWPPPLQNYWGASPHPPFLRL